jgi:hypothetical protein
MDPLKYSREVVLEEALLVLVTHDLAADRREKASHCIELQHAVKVLVEHCGYTESAFALRGTAEGN